MHYVPMRLPASLQLPTPAYISLFLSEMPSSSSWYVNTSYEQMGLLLLRNAVLIVIFCRAFSPWQGKAGVAKKIFLDAATPKM